MTYNLYIDVLFLVNLIMDFLLLTILRKLLKYRTTNLRMILSSSVGAAWAAVITAWPLLPGWFAAVVTYIFISAFMVKTAYALKGVREVARGVVGLYLAAVLFGGTIYAMYQHVKAGYYMEQAIPLAILLLMAAGAFFGVKYLWFSFMQIKARKNNLYQVTLHYKGRIQAVTALMDTGNHLYEPISHKPVHVITYEALKLLCESVSAIIYIPFQSVGKQDGMLPGIFLDKMEVRQGENVVIIEKPLVAICRQPLSPNGEYEMLLHEE